MEFLYILWKWKIWFAWYLIPQNKKIIKIYQQHHWNKISILQNVRKIPQKFQIFGHKFFAWTFIILLNYPTYAQFIAHILSHTIIYHAQLLSTFYCALSIVHILLCTAYCPHFIMHSLLSTFYCAQFIVHILLCTVYCLHLIMHSPLSTFYCPQSIVYRPWQDNVRDGQYNH